MNKRQHFFERGCCRKENKDELLRGGKEQREKNWSKVVWKRLKEGNHEPKTQKMGWCLGSRRARQQPKKETKNLWKCKKMTFLWARNTRKHEKRPNQTKTENKKEKIQIKKRRVRWRAVTLRVTLPQPKPSRRQKEKTRKGASCPPLLDLPFLLWKR